MVCPLLGRGFYTVLFYKFMVRLVKSVYEPRGPSGRSLSRFPPDGMLVHRRVTPSSKFAGTHLYTWVERGTLRVKCLAQGHNAVPRPGLEPEPNQLEKMLAFLDGSIKKIK